MHKTRYLRRAVMRFEWARQPTSMLTSSRYSFTQFLTALQEGILLNEEIARANGPGANYGQYPNNPHDVRHPNYPRLDLKHGYDHEEIILGRRIVVEIYPDLAEDLAVDLEVPTIYEVETTTGTGRTPPYPENGTTTVVVRRIKSLDAENLHRRFNKSARTWLVSGITPKRQQKNLLPNL